MDLSEEPAYIRIAKRHLFGGAFLHIMCNCARTGCFMGGALLALF